MRPLARAAIVAVGSELLTPLRTDTNSLFLTEQLNAIGIDVVWKAIVGDDREELAWLLRATLERADLVILTGGLGPTDDDVTRETVADVLGRPLVEDARLTEALQARFAARGFAGPMPANNRRQAMVPAGARVLENAHGSAPGLWIEEGAGVVLLLPGPPRELRPMLTAAIERLLQPRAPGGALVRRVIRITGRIESETDETLQPLYQAWAASEVRIGATILAHPGQIELHLVVRTGSRAEAEHLLDGATAQVLDRLGDDVFSTDGRSLEEVVGDLLAARRLRVGLAESCTGGLLASRLTDVPGSSRYLDRAIVAYANEAKVALLDVPPAVLAAHGAVSDEVARAMAQGIRMAAGVDVGVGVTGIAGPGGGTPEKPVGTVAVAVETARASRSHVFRFLGGRDLVKYQASQAALDMTRRLLLQSSPVA